MNNYTSLKLSKWLSEAGCELESEMWWINIFKRQGWEIVNKTEWDLNGHHEFYRAYDIMNDICIKYIDVFFEDMKDSIITTKEIQCITIINYLRQSKKDEAEKYIKENCLFNKK